MDVAPYKRVIKQYCPFNFPDNTTVSQVLTTAKKLSLILQQNGNMSQSPDPVTASILNTWLETHLPVSHPDILNSFQYDQKYSWSTAFAINGQSFGMTIAIALWLTLQHD